ncbi:MAG TPA: hypothetical protein VEI57_16635 [Nitrospirota bacterium]|nr:hypothetical protein [Nitrospirota bacterium]
MRISAVLFLMVLVAAIGNASYPATDGWIPAMKQNVSASQKVPSKPPIDTQLSKQVATATFAMG